MFKQEFYFKPGKYKYVVEKLDCLGQTKGSSVHRYKITVKSRFRTHSFYCAGKFKVENYDKEFDMLLKLRKLGITNYFIRKFPPNNFESIKYIRSQEKPDIDEKFFTENYLWKMIFIKDFNDLDDILEVFPCNNRNHPSKRFKALSLDQKFYFVDRIIEDMKEMAKNMLLTQFIDCWMIILGKSKIEVILSDTDKLFFSEKNISKERIMDSYKDFFYYIEKEICDYFFKRLEEEKIL